MKYSVTIGIPAYNEDKNLARLVESLLSQSDSSFVLDKIIVSSDGSTDDTVGTLKLLKNDKLYIIDNQDRQGIARGLNQIIGLSKSDILVFLDADITVRSPLFIKELIKPITDGLAEFTSSSIHYLPDHSRTSRVLQIGEDIKSILFNSLSNANNLYHSYGLARALSHKFYHDLSIPLSVGNDMFTYLECRNRGMRFIYAPKSCAWYKLPQVFNDYLSQSKRFSAAGSSMYKYFAKNVVDKELQITGKVYLRAFTRSMGLIMSHPVLFIIYLYYQLYSHLTRPHRVEQAWTIAESSK